MRIVSIIITCVCGRHFATPEANAGRRARCGVCGHELLVPHPALPSDVLYISDVPEPASTSGRAVASIALGALFFFGCLSGLPAILFGLRALSEIGRSGGRLRGKRMAVGGIVLGVIECVSTLALFLMPLADVRPGVPRAQCVNHLKQIGLAMHNYHSVNGCLPPAAITDKNGRPLLSWRVAILPYLEQGPLYAKFHLNEPWDSPHNLALLDQMPNGYACPTDRTLKRGMTSYLAVVGPGTAFMPDFKPVRLDDFTDGTSTTFLVGESRRSVPWTMPEDLAFDVPLPLNGLGSHHKDGFNALLADGSVRFLKDSINPSVLRSLFTRSGNEVSSDDCY
jgi:hypothetical protein